MLTSKQEKGAGVGYPCCTIATKLRVTAASSTARNRRKAREKRMTERETHTHAHAHAHTHALIYWECVCMCVCVCECNVLCINANHNNENKRQHKKGKPTIGVRVTRTLTLMLTARADDPKRWGHYDARSPEHPCSRAAPNPVATPCAGNAKEEEALSGNAVAHLSGQGKREQGGWIQTDGCNVGWLHRWTHLKTGDGWSKS